MFIYQSQLVWKMKSMTPLNLIYLYTVCFAANKNQSTKKNFYKKDRKRHKEKFMLQVKNSCEK